MDRYEHSNSTIDFNLLKKDASKGKINHLSGAPFLKKVGN